MDLKDWLLLGQYNNSSDIKRSLRKQTDMVWVTLTPEQRAEYSRIQAQRARRTLLFLVVCGLLAWAFVRYGSTSNSPPAEDHAIGEPVTTPASGTPNIDQLEQMYGAATRFDYVSGVWGTQLPELTAGDVRRIVTDRELSDADYVVTLPRDETSGHAVLVDRKGSPILAVHTTAEPARSSLPQPAAQAQDINLGPTKPDPNSSTLIALPEGVSGLIEKWVTTTKDRDIETRLSLYAEDVDQFYTKHGVTRTDIYRELVAMYNRYSEISVLRLSNLSWNQTGTDVVTITLDKHFEATLSGSSWPNSRRVGDVQSQLVLRHFEEGWKIISESDPRIYSISK